MGFELLPLAQFLLGHGADTNARNRRGETPRRLGKPVSATFPDHFTASVSSLATIPARSAEIHIPYFAGHVYAFSGLWRSRGFSVGVLPLPDASIRILGEAHSQGRECHPYAMIAGDLLDLYRHSGGRPLVYYYPNTSVPCLLQQYAEGMQSLLREPHIDSITAVYSGGSDPSRQMVLDAFVGQVRSHHRRHGA